MDVLPFSEFEHVTGGESSWWDFAKGYLVTVVGFEAGAGLIASGTAVTASPPGTVVATGAMVGLGAYTAGSVLGDKVGAPAADLAVTTYYDVNDVLYGWIYGTPDAEWSGGGGSF